MSEQFNLSEKILEHKKMGELMSLLPDDVLLRKDVKEFIRLLKIKIQETMRNNEIGSMEDCVDIYDEIDKLAGEKLTK